MDIQRANRVFAKAIVGLQGAEIEAMIEAMAHGATGTYKVKPPAGYAGRYRVPTPRDVEPKGGIQGLERRVAFSTALLNMLKRLKKDVKGVTRVYQGYRGTGRKKDRRQVFVDFEDSGRNIDLFIEPSAHVKVGGVLHPRKGLVSTSDRTPDEVYKEIKVLMQAHAKG